MQNYSYENDFDLHENKPACRTHFHMNGFALGLVLKQRHNGTSEMAYCVYLASAPVKFTLLLVHESNFCAAWYFTSFLSSIIRLKALHHALSTKKRRVLFSPMQYKTNSRNSSNLRTGSDGVIK